MDIAQIRVYPLSNCLNNNNVHLATDCGELLCVTLWVKQLKPCCYVSHLLFCNVELRKRSARCVTQ
jgi:hypothetical protein